MDRSAQYYKGDPPDINDCSRQASQAPNSSRRGMSNHITSFLLRLICAIEGNIRI